MASKRVILGLGAALVLVVAAGVALAFALPAWAKHRFVTTAARQGIEARVESVSLSFAQARFLGVSFASASLPGVGARAAELSVTLDGLQPIDVTISGAVVEIDGALGDVAARLEAFGDKLHAGAAAAATTTGAAAEARSVDESLRLVRAVSLRDGTLAWKNALGPATSITAKGITATAERPAAGALGDTYAAVATAVTAQGIGRGLGPFRANVGRENGAFTMRLFLNPAVPSGPPEVAFTSVGATTRLEATIPRTKVGALGVPPALFGLPDEEDVEVALKLSGSLFETSRLDATVDGTLHNARVVRGAPVTADVRLRGTVGGEPAAPLAFTAGTLTFTPTASLLGASAGVSIVARVTGQVEPVLSLDPKARALVGVRGNLAFQTPPTPCADLARQSVERIAQTLDSGLGNMMRGLSSAGARAAADLGNAVGVKSGSFSLQGTIAFDTRRPTATSAEVTRVDACGLPIFAPR